MENSVICDEGKFQCRKCRFILFKWTDLSELHDVSSECSLWFLRDDDMLPWVQDLVNESGWTKGKLYCPQCEARIGAFDFIHVITCGCGKESIPSIYCVQSKIDYNKIFQRNQHTACIDDDHVVDHDFEFEENHNSNNFLQETTNSFEGIELTEFRSNSYESQADFNESIDHFEILDSVILERDHLLLERELITEEENLAVQIKEPNLDDVFNKMSSSTKSSLKTLPASASQLEALFQSTEVSFLDSQETSLELSNSVNVIDNSDNVDINQALIEGERTFELKKRNISTSVCTNPCFDPNESDNEDYLINTRTFTSFPRSSRRLPSYDSHQTAPRVLTCSRCRNSYNRFLEQSEQRRFNRSCICDQNCGASQGDTSDSETEETLTTINPCTCSNNRQFEIYNDLMSVRQDMARLQDLIQSTTNLWPTESRRRRNQRRRQRNKRRENRVRRDVTTSDSSAHVRCEVDSQESDIEIPDNYQCPVCLDIYYEPKTTECSHTFCAPCLRQLNKTSNRRPLCPLCRRQLYQVESREELHDDVKRLFPRQYRKRYLTERRRTINQFPLPSRTSVRFAQEPSYFSTRLMHFLNVARTFLIVLFMFITFAINREGRNNQFRRQSNYAKLFFVLLMVLICTFLGTIIGLFVSFYAYDLLKYLVGFILFYVIVVKYAMTVLHE